MPRQFFLVLFLTVAINTGMGMIIPIMPTLLKEYGFGTLGLSLPFAALILARIVSKPWAGVALNRLGARYLMLTVFAVYSLTFFLYPLCHSPIGFIFLRVLEGFAEGVGGVVLANAAIVMTTGRQNRGVLMGYFSAAFGVGFIVGPMIGWLALENIGTTGMFFVGGGIGLLGLIFSAMLPRKTSESLPVKASMRDLANNMRYLIPYIPSVLRRTLFFSFMIIVPLSATGRLGVSPEKVGLLFTASGIISTVGMFFTGKLADIFDPRRLTAWCLVGMGVLIVMCGLARSVEEFLIFYLAETLFFAIMLPAGTKVFAAAVDNHPLREPMVGSFGSFTEICTLVLAFLLPAIVEMNITGAWIFVGGLCVIGAVLLLRWQPLLRDNSEVVSTT